MLTKKHFDVRAVLWLLIGVALVVSPMLFAYSAVFGLGDSLFVVGVVALFMLFAGAVWLLYFRFKRLGSVELVGTLVCFAIPLVFAYFWVYSAVPLLVFALYVLMHCVFAGGVVTLWANRGKIRALL